MAQNMGVYDFTNQHVGQLWRSECGSKLDTPKIGCLTLKMNRIYGSLGFKLWPSIPFYGIILKLNIRCWDCWVGTWKWRDLPTSWRLEVTPKHWEVFCAYCWFYIYCSCLKHQVSEVNMVEPQRKVDFWLNALRRYYPPANKGSYGMLWAMAMKNTILDILSWFNIAIEHHPFIDYFPIYSKPPFSSGSVC
jgi:hypothetical protein